MKNVFIDKKRRDCEVGDHKFSLWKYVDSVSDERHCIYCAEKEMRTIFDPNLSSLNLDLISHYLPYGLRCNLMGMFIDDNADPVIPKVYTIVGASKFEVKVQMNKTIHDGWIYEEVFPLLKPISLLTKEELRSVGFKTHIDYIFDFGVHLDYLPYNMVKYLLSKHYDVFNLIPNKLAISNIK